MMALEAIKNFEEIGLTKAQDYTKAWQDHFDLKAFFFHKNDIECVIHEETAVGVRFYTGIEDDGEKKCPVMMLVGVNENGVDLINDESKIATSSDNEIDTGIYNFTLPCPRTCDNTSALYFLTGPVVIGSALCGLPNEGRVPSTPNICNVKEYQISVTDAQNSAANWQEDFNLISVLFDKDELTALFNEFGVESMRVYFGIAEDGIHKIILVGVNKKGLDKTDIELGDKLFINTIPLCTNNNATSCDTTSILYNAKNI